MTEQATTAQIAYITKLQGEKAHRRTVVMDDFAVDIKHREVMYNANQFNSDSGIPAVADYLVFMEEYRAVGREDRDAQRAMRPARDELEASVKAAVREALTAGHAQRVAALDVDPATVTKGEASALIDSLKAL